MADENRFSVKKLGLGRQLLWLILLLVLVPAIVISLISYKTSEQQFYSNAVHELKTVSSLQNDYLAEYLDKIQLDLQVESNRQANTLLLELLNEGHSRSTLTTVDFIDSFQWALVVEEHGQDLKTFWDAYGYFDIFLVDFKGNILFSLNKNDDLGSNLFAGKYSDSHFASAVLKTFETGQISFSDFGVYRADSQEIDGFFANVLLDEFGDKIGAIAFQINDRKIQNILREHGVQDSRVETYLLGTDLLMRSNPLPGQIDDALNTRLGSEEIQRWIDLNINVEEGIVTEDTKPFSHLGPRGQEVLSVLRPFKIADQYFVLATEQKIDDVFAASDRLALEIAALLIIAIAVVIMITIPVSKQIVRPVLDMAATITRVSAGDLTQLVKINSRNELGTLADGLNNMMRTLRSNKIESEKREWIQQGISGLNDIIRGEQNIATLSSSIISFLCQYFDAPIGAFYYIKDDRIKLTGSYAFTTRKGFVNEFKIGEGIVGQAVLEQKTLKLHDVPEDYVAIGSGLGHVSPKYLSVMPVLWNDQVVAVIEIGSLDRFTDDQENLLEILSQTIGVSVNTATANDQTLALLEQTQAQTEELQAREEELHENNQMLEQQSTRLEKNAVDLEEKNNALQAQQEELRAANEELEIKASELETSGAILEERNHALDQAKLDLEKKAEDLEISSRYKSEFLANMSHELRTPLNSLLILAKLLSENKTDNLNSKQVQYATTIHDSGTDLLNLINDILDLSKIEAGRADLHIEQITLQHFAEDLERKFKPLVETKGISFVVKNTFPEASIQSDSQKLAQVVKNLLSNAVKFTEKGGVTLSFSEAEAQYLEDQPASQFIQISIQDSGIGIAKNKQSLVFEAFKQADGTTSRKFGGTGLGLSISRELAKLLGGEIHLQSEPGVGSTFIVLVKRHLVAVETHLESDTPYIKPLTAAAPKLTQTAGDTLNSPVAGATSKLESTEIDPVADDRRTIDAEDRSVLIIEDDHSFAEVLTEITHQKGFKVLIAEDGETGLHLADFYSPSAIILDIGLPGIDGWQVVDRLKSNLNTRHIPVHIMSGEDKSINAFRNGVMSFMTKPVSMESIAGTLQKIEEFIDQPVRKLLIVEDNQVQSDSIIELIGEGDIEIKTASSGEQAINLMKNNRFDCVVLDLKLPDMDGAALLEKLRNQPETEDTPIVIYSGKELSRQEQALLDQYANRVIIKNARSPEILLDETALFLHRVQSQMPADRQKVLRMLHNNESVLKNRQVLVVDDDMRNVFALTTMLREKDVQVTTAKDGKDALAKLDQMESPDLVLMDVMMPEMDGYEAMERIRQQSKYQDLPIIALTAKAMKGDRAKCIKAGASDYLSKPIDVDKLLSMMRVWLYR